MGKSTASNTDASSNDANNSNKRNSIKHSRRGRSWSQKKRRFRKNLWNHRPNEKISTTVSVDKLKKLHVSKRKENKLHLNKPENVFNLSRLKALNKTLMDSKMLSQTKEEQPESQIDASPNQGDAHSEDEHNDTCMDAATTATAAPMKISSLPNTFEPGSMVEMPQKIKCRSWKSVQHQHLSKLQEFNPKRLPTFGHSMYDKKERNSMKEVENLLRDEIRAEKQMEARKKKQREEMKKINEIRGMVVKPIRNMHKLKKFTKKQWKTVMKAQVEIHNPRNALRSTYIARQ
eukprot:CAMPEP_0197027624 /NCGR_PEP_ID=MMETSP1384-20130603/7503_1 /TAXON_ID=29189 /ORGANISM="Ammonia sp." /LENGTH=288 /DNA_ID=CAMNT_0042456495 /DNA_START=12 /DNA_END=878 /DNA_ORIENTATION=+